MTLVDIEINPEDLRILRDRMTKLGADGAYRQALEIIGRSIKSQSAIYPPETIANWPSNPSGHWYVRGFGTKFASGAEYQTSQDMKHKWFTRTFPNYTEIWNEATYSPYIHGPDQVAWAGQRGWKKLQDIATEKIPEILRLLAAQVEKIWGGRT